jgi:quinol monooxygenase YgiN
MIHVLALIEVTPGRRDEFLVKFRELVPKVRAEKGCMEYGPTVDFPSTLSVQTPVGEGIVVVVEKWDSVQALEDHLAAPHMQAYRQSVENIVVGITIHVLQPV